MSLWAVTAAQEGKQEVTGQVTISIKPAITDDCTKKKSYCSVSNATCQTVCFVTHSHSISARGLYSHFTDEEMGAQRDEWLAMKAVVD